MAQGRFQSLRDDGTLMTKTYLQVMKQIQGLQAEADKLRHKEIKGVIARIREAIDHYGLTAADLSLDAKPGRAAPARKPRKAGAAKPTAAARAEVKFRDEAGRVWGGRGPRPKWLREAIASGRKLEEFKVG
jgi:DNA-binding protein H-NS